MGCTFFLLRHGITDHVGEILSGRAPGISLNAEGRSQAQRLAVQLATEPLRHVYTSPLARTRETAEFVASLHGLPLVEAEEIIEADFGEWTLRSFEDLSHDPAWRSFNEHRAITRPPGGESFEDLAQRVWPWVEHKANEHADDTIAVVTHADVIKAALLRALQRPLQHIGQLVVDPGSRSALFWSPPTPPVVTCINRR